MANEFYTPEQAATVAAAALGKDLNLAAKVTRDFSSNFRAGTGAVVNVRVPGAVKAQTRNPFDKSTPLVHGEIAEATIPVTIDEQAYDIVSLSTGDLALDLENYTAEVLMPQAQAISGHLESKVAGVMAAVPATALAYNAAEPQKTVTQMRRTLRENGVSAEEPITLIGGAAVYADFLDAEAIADNGTVRGIPVEESTRIPADEMVAFIKPAIVLVTVAPAVPEGAGWGASVAHNGNALTVLRQYNANVAADESLVQVLVGAREMPLAVVEESTGTVSLVEHGGIVRVDTAA